MSGPVDVPGPRVLIPEDVRVSVKAVRDDRRGTQEVTGSPRR